MLSRATRLLLSQAWYHPFRFLAGALLLYAFGVALGASTYRLIERQQSVHARTPTRSLTKPGTLLPLITLLFCLLDWVLLAALPRLRLSFATGTEVVLPLLASALVRLFLLWGLAAAKLLPRLGWWLASRPQIGRGRRSHRLRPYPGLGVRTPSAISLLLASNVAFSLAQVDAYVVEPLLVQTTELGLSFDSLDPRTPPVRVVHLTDVHIARNSYREAAIIRQINALKPDLIVLTGDYLNLSRLHDPTSIAHFREFAAQLEAPYGIYAVRGSVEPLPEGMARLVKGTNIIWLEQETRSINVRGQQVTLVGVACSHDLEWDTLRLEAALASAPGNTFTLLLYHSPDLILEAAERRVDLYLGGHTHGGQLRLPALGPIVTGSVYGHRYAAGLFRESDTWMYVSRGLGLEGGGMPRARFLCRPEIVSLDIGGIQHSATKELP